jgi:hypothetical protein
VIQAAQLIALAVALVDDAQELGAEGTAFDFCGRASRLFAREFVWLAGTSPLFLQQQTQA